MTPAHRRILETLADPERRAGLRPDEREAVRAALGLEAEVERLASERAEADHATVAARLDALRLERERDAIITAAVTEWPNGRWAWWLGWRGSLDCATRAEAVVHLCHTLGLEVPTP